MKEGCLGSLLRFLLPEICAPTIEVPHEKVYTIETVNKVWDVSEPFTSAR